MTEDIPLVIDNGSRMMKAGFATDETPCSIFLSVVGQPRYSTFGFILNQDDRFIGESAVSKRGILTLKYPIKDGNITSWENIERIWHYIFYNELRVAPEEHSVLLTEAPFAPKTNREKMAQIMFEAFNTPAMSVSNTAALSLYATGRTTGIVVESGDGVTSAIPISEGSAICQANLQSSIAGRDLTHYLSDLARELGYTYITNATFDTARDIKEKLCYVALDFDQEMQSIIASTAHEKSYELPDGSLLSINSERFRVPEALFKPHFLNNESSSIQDLTYNAIIAAGMDIRRDMYRNIILAGGSTMFPGFGERLEKEVDALVPSSAAVKVVSTPERKYAAWLGGAALASTTTSQAMWVTRAEYDDSGPSIVYRKCF